jgi:hypothetical protein
MDESENRYNGEHMALHRLDAEVYYVVAKEFGFDVHMKKSTRTFKGQRSAFEYSFQKMNGRRLRTPVQLVAFERNHLDPRLQENKVTHARLVVRVATICTS